MLLTLSVWPTQLKKSKVGAVSFVVYHDVLPTWLTNEKPQVSNPQPNPITLLLLFAFFFLSVLTMKFVHKKVTWRTSTAFADDSNLPSQEIPSPPFYYFFKKKKKPAFCIDYVFIFLYSAFLRRMISICPFKRFLFGSLHSILSIVFLNSKPWELNKYLDWVYITRDKSWV